MSSSANPRRSARIAALHAVKNSKLPVLFNLNAPPAPSAPSAPSAPPASLKAPLHSLPRRMGDVDIDMQEYKAWAADTKKARNTKDYLHAFQKQLEFLQERPYLLDYADEKMIEKLTADIQKFHTSHEDYNQQLANKLSNAMRKDKYFHIITTTNVCAGTFLSTLHAEKETHNLFVTVYLHAMKVNYLIKNRNQD
jgi:hypothetical protein